MPKVVPEYKEQAIRNIVEAGAYVFNEKGYHKTKMDDIAEKLGVSKGAIYQYFKSKEQLFFEVIDFFLRSRKDEIMTILISGDPKQIASAKFLKMKIERAQQTRSFGLDLFLEAARNEKLRKKMTAVYEESFTEFLDHIDRLKREGIIKREADVGVVWRGIVALRDGLLNSILFGANIKAVTETWEQIATILIDEILVEKNSELV
ncbi:TetR/AcrR family transcriptional regulator [Candidatus Thorarchaeota archaeon]|nr:MAG: TetR/AcrR family transcriptional regulator [Candidatus Thorarchaeota archaeon]